MSQNSTHRSTPRLGFTQVELIVALSLSLIVIAGILSAYAFLGRNLTRLVNTEEQSVKSRRALVQFTQDVGAAISLITTTSSDFTFTIPLSLSNCATTSGSATVTCATTAGMLAGREVWGTGIPSGATVSSITNATTFVLSANATATSTGATLYTAVRLSYVYNTSPPATLTRANLNTGVTTTLLTGLDVTATNPANGFVYYNQSGSSVSSAMSIKSVEFSFTSAVGSVGSGTRTKFTTVSPRVILRNKPLLL